ncbi:MAG: hypothetical protein MHM6MM_006617 [Cercozoa sp. M6MM]
MVDGDLSLSEFDGSRHPMSRKKKLSITLQASDCSRLQLQQTPLAITLFLFQRPTLPTSYSPLGVYDR